MNSEMTHKQHLSMHHACRRGLSYVPPFNFRVVFFFMTGMVAVGVLSAAPVLAQSDVENDEIAFEPIADGGARFTIPASSMKLTDESGERQDSSTVFDISKYFRFGCFLVSPKVPIPEASIVYISPRVDMVWMDAMELREGNRLPLMELRIVTEDYDSGDRKIDRKYVWTSDLELTPVYFEDRDTIFYYGETHAASASHGIKVFRSQIRGNRGLHLELCGLRWNTELVVSSVVVEVAPR